jgi:hypothetical protein
MSKLVDGNIPAHSACPYINSCQGKMQSCPTAETVRPHQLSCALARLHAMIDRSPNGNGLLKKVRDSFKPSE